eukprot:230413-Pyramimonas_sp.AAC.1
MTERGGGGEEESEERRGIGVLEWSGGRTATRRHRIRPTILCCDVVPLPLHSTIPRPLSHHAIIPAPPHSQTTTHTFSFFVWSLGSS